MTLNELIEAIDEENDNTLYERELFFYEEISNGNCIITNIKSLGLFEDKIFLSLKCPYCDD